MNVDENVRKAAYALVGPRSFDFGKALDVLRLGARVYRSNWNGKQQWLEIQQPDLSSKMTLPYIYIRTVQGDLVPWLASQTDMLAFDWALVLTTEADEDDDIPF